MQSCHAQELQNKFSQPTEQFELSKELNEISGLTLLSDSEIAAVQDEKGKIYILSTQDGKILKEIEFGKKGDYEGITKYKKHFYVLKSNGSIYKVDKSGDAKEYALKQNKGYDFEGLCLDAVNKRLLVACKEHGNKDKRDAFYIYSFSLETKEYEKKPAYKIKRSKVNDNFKPSGIAIHPNGNIYVLSSFSKTLCVLSKSGEILEVTKLNKSIFNQPEGITFNSKGDLYISNEKKNDIPTLLKFNIDGTLK